MNFSPVSRDEFEFAIDLMNAAATLTMPVENPESRHLNIYDEKTGEVMEIRFCDTPITRALVALGNHFDHEKARSLGMRWFALLDVAKRPLMKAWVRETPDGGAEISGQLVGAAAKCPLRRGKFKIHEIARLARAERV